MKLKNEIPSILIILLPFIYLAYVWNELPEKVPMHWNINGEIDRYGEKMELVLIPILLPLLIYFIFLVIPKIDPKNNLNKMGNKFEMIKILLTTFMSILALFIIYSAKNQSFSNPNYMILLVGIMYIILGNYFKTIKPNYFLGIRTPWTLENETVWKKTHRLGGKLWFIGGIMVVLSSLVFNKEFNFTIFMIVTVIIALVPVLYSFIIFNKYKAHIKKS